MRSRLVVVAALVCGVVVTAAAQPQPRGRMQMPVQGRPLPPRDTSARREAPPTGTALISGRVVSAESGVPLRRATVRATLRRTGGTNNGRPSFTGFTARTDDEGRFVIRNLPAGEYDVNAFRSGYVSGSFGQARLDMPGRAVVVSDGAAMANIDIRLHRGGVITGRVVDDVGEPVERARVVAMRVRRQGGAAMSMTGQTDDLGMFRLFGIMPGDYIVRADIFGGRPMPDSSDSEEMELAGTYAPSTLNEAEAQIIRVQSGVESPIDVQLVTVRPTTIRGRVTTSSGQPMANGMVSLSSSLRGPGPGGFGAQVTDGTFLLRGVAPGTYTLQVMSRPDGRGEPWQPATERAAETITVSGGEINVTVTTGRASVARGRIVVESGNPALVRAASLTVMARSVVGETPGATSIGQVERDLTFELNGLFGAQTPVLAGLPSGWRVKDIRLEGQSGLDGIDFGYGRTITGLEIVVTDRPTGVTGTVSLPAGGDAPEAAVLLFSTDETRWALVNATMPAVRLVSLASNGTFRIDNVRPGSYFIVAFPSGADVDDVTAPEQLRMLAARARTVDVDEDRLTNVALTLVEP